MYSKLLQTEIVKCFVDAQKMSLLGCVKEFSEKKEIFCT
jgi:hypothetical protein